MYNPSSQGPPRRVNQVGQQSMRSGGMPGGNPGNNNTGAPVQSRIPEMLDQAKAEFDGLLQQVNIFKMERDEFERQLQSQLQEMEQFQQTIVVLEQNHRRCRQQYEEDVMRLRRQLESSGQMENNNNNDGPSNNSNMGMSQSMMMQQRGNMQQQHQRSSVPSPMRGGNNSSAIPPRSTNSMGQQQQPPSGHMPQRSMGMASLHSAANNVSSMGSNNVGRSVGGMTSSSAPPTSAPMAPMHDGSNQSTPRTNGPTVLPPVSEGVPRESNFSSQPPRSSLPMSTSQASTPAADSPNSNVSNNQIPPFKKAKTDSPFGTQPPVSGGGADSIPNETTAPTSADDAEQQSAKQSTENAGDTANAEEDKGSVKWTITHNSAAGAYPETERPHVEMQHTLDHQSVVCCVKFSKDGSMMASGCHKTAQVFDVQTGQQIFSVSRPPAPATNDSDSEDAYVRAVCFSPDGKKVVAGMPQQVIRVWDLDTKKEGLNLVGHESEIYSLDYVNNLIASGSGDRKVRLWDANSGSCHHIFGSESDGPTDGVTSVALSPDGRLLAAASLDKVVRIWDTNTSQLLDRLEGHSDSVYSIAFSPDGKNIISGSLDRTLMLWDVSASGQTTTRPRLLFQGHKDFVLSAAYTPDGRWLMSGSKDRSVMLWDPRSTRSVLTLSGYRNSVISVASSPASPHFATGSGDCFACIWKYECQTL